MIDPILNLFLSFFVWVITVALLLRIPSVITFILCWMATFTMIMVGLSAKLLI